MAARQASTMSVSGAGLQHVSRKRPPLAPRTGTARCRASTASATLARACACAARRRPGCLSSAASRRRESTRSTSSLSAFSTASAPSAASATTSRSGLASSTLRQPRADDRKVVGDQDPRHQRDRHQLCTPTVRRSRARGNFEPHLDAAAAHSLDRERAVDEQCALTHAAQPAVLVGRLGVEATAVVRDAQDDAVEAALERRPSPGSPSRDVRRWSGSPGRSGRWRARSPAEGPAARRRIGVRRECLRRDRTSSSARSAR